MGKMNRGQYVKLIKPEKKKKKTRTGGTSVKKKKTTNRAWHRGPVLKTTYPILCLTGSKGCTKKRRNSLLNTLTPRELSGFSSISRNFLNKNIAVKPGQLKRMVKYKKMMRKLASSGTSSATKKKMLKQNGGFLSGLLPIIAKVAGALFGL
jgi:hypothetical protein